MRFIFPILLIITSLFFSGCTSKGEIQRVITSPEAANRSAGKVVDFLKAPSGFTISYYTESVPGARSLALAPNGTVFVGTRETGKVYALPDSNQDSIPDDVITIASGLNSPNGIAFKDDTLYVAEISRILKFPSITTSLTNPTFEILPMKLPTDRAHGWRYLAFGPDNALYIPIGAPCNICSINPPYATLNRLDLSTGQLTPIATGIRNTVGFDWHPVTKKLWFTDNGRDGLGDNLPPDELNRLDETGEFFGYPNCHGRSIRDPEFGHLDCTQSKPPILELDPHAAALGIKFYTGTQFPSEFQNSAFIAQHGSWDRSEKIGYKVIAVPTSEDSASFPKDFVTGWLTENGEVLGRPVDLVQLLDGSLLISDDKKGVIYRVTYQQ